jgi:uncharacterized protein YuzE
MNVKVGPYDFDRVSYDESGDVLYLRAGASRPAARTLATPEGHAVRFDDAGQVIGITIVNAKWLIERDGKVTLSVPNVIEAAARELQPALSGS